MHRRCDSGRVVGLHCDIRHADQAMADTLARPGRVDSFFANAGITSAALR